MSLEQNNNIGDPKHLDWAPQPVRALLRLSWPIAVSMVSYALMTLVDTLFVATMGTAALAGVGVAGTVAFGLLAFHFGFFRAVNTLTAQAVGAGTSERTGSLLRTAALLAVGAGVFTLLAGQYAARLLPGLTATSASGEYAAQYLSVRILGAPVAVLFVVFREFRHAHNDTRSPMLAVVTGNVVNILLDWVFVGGFGLGVTSVAVATVVGQLAQFGVLLRFQIKRGFPVGRVQLAVARRLLLLGLPIALQFILEFGSFTLLALLLAARGETDMAAHQIAIQVIHFTFLPIAAVAEAGAVLAGQATGARRTELIRPLGRKTFGVAAIYAILCTVVLGTAAPWIAGWFTSAPELIRVSVVLLYLAAVFQIFDAANVVARCVLRGTGDVRVPAVVGVTLAWLLTPTAAWWLGWRLGWGAIGGWIGLTAEVIIGAFVLWWRLERRAVHLVVVATRERFQAS